MHLFILTEYSDWTLMEIVHALAPRVDSSGGPAVAVDRTDGGSVVGAGTVYACSLLRVSRLWELFWQVVEGLAYLHSRGIVHRDVKSSNVFASGPDMLTAAIKIGDLGLATTFGSTSHGGAAGAVAPTPHPTAPPLPAAGSSGGSDSGGDMGGGGGGAALGGYFASIFDDSSAGGGTGGSGGGGGGGEVSVAVEESMAPAAAAAAAAAMRAETRGVGTYFYMAPEAEQGVYSDKSDMYALGALLYEMFSRFQTAHERARMLNALKTGSVPRSFIDAFPFQAQLISNLMQADAASRPAAADLLRYRYFQVVTPPADDATGDAAAAAAATAAIAGVLHLPPGATLPPFVQAPVCLPVAASPHSPPTCLVLSPSQLPPPPPPLPLPPGSRRAVSVGTPAGTDGGGAGGAGGVGATGGEGVSTVVAALERALAAANETIAAQAARIRHLEGALGPTVATRLPSGEISTPALPTTSPLLSWSPAGGAGGSAASAGVGVGAGSSASVASDMPAVSLLSLAATAVPAS